METDAYNVNTQKDEGGNHMTFGRALRLQNHIVVWVGERIEKNKKEKLDKQKKEEFLEEINRARKDLQFAQNNYNYATEPALLDYYIYEIKAAETRLNYYIKMAKKEKLSNENFLASLRRSSYSRGEGVS